MRDDDLSRKSFHPSTFPSETITDCGWSFKLCGDEINAFGSAPDGPRTLVIHRQRAIKEGAGAVLDNTRGKKSKAVRQKKADEVAGREDNLSSESKKILRNFVGEFLRAGFNCGCMCRRVPN